ncbi:MAG: ABC transporter ATP-binding protein [Pseudothermotoga sp.]
MALIETHDLTKYYGRHRAVENFNFEVNEGETFGFIGPNGAGKTTTIRILLGLIFPTSGQAKIFGKDCVRDGPQIRKLVGYVPSEVNYYANATVEELLGYFASFYKSVDKTYMKELCARFEIDTKKKFRELSTGNKKKVAVVQALLHRPKLLICDEPTIGLDPIMQNKLLELLEELKAQGVTIFFSSHILNEVQRLCDRFVMIKEGKIIKIESIEALRNKNYKMVRLQLKDRNQWKRVVEKFGPNVKTKDSAIVFEFFGNIDQLMKELSSLSLENVWIEDPSLEDFFMTFYSEVRS